MDILKKLNNIKAITLSTNDIGASSIFHAVFKDENRYNTTAKEWFYYDGSVWKIDREGMRARNNAKLLWQNMKKYSAQVDAGENEIKAFDDMVARWGGSRYRDQIIKDSRDLEFVQNEDFDVDDYMFNCNNGTLDLKTFEFLSHKPSDFLSLKASVDYDNKASCERWLSFIDEVMQGDEEKTRYLQKLSGICLTGDASIEKMWFLYGSTTRNGKSTFIEMLADMMGDYSISMRPETLAIRQNNDSRTASGDVARLAGKRLAVCSEPPKRMLLDTALLKSLTGGDRIVARHLHQSEFQFVPKFKLLVNTNFLPVVTDQTVFSSNRIQVISFDRHFTEDEQDIHLKDKLRAEKSGILNWCLEGLRMYYDEGLEAPGCVVSSTKEYLGQSDKLQNFIDDMLEPCEGHNLSVKKLYKKYGEWCDDNGYHTESKGNFIIDLRTKGIYKARGQVEGVQTRNIVADYAYNDEFSVDSKDFEIPFRQADRQK